MGSGEAIPVSAGGHFAALEEPPTMVEDIWAFYCE